MLDAPETTGGYCAFLRIGREALGGAIGIESHTGAGSERPEEARYEVGHCGGHEDSED